MTTEEIAALPNADAEQRHVQDEIEHADDYDHFQHGEFPECCGKHPQAAPITITFCTMPDEAGQ